MSTKPQVLIEQRPTVASTGPSVYPSLSLDLRSRENATVVVTLAEQHRAALIENESAPYYVDNKTACTQLLEALPAKRSIMNWESPLLMYLASGGLCPRIPSPGTDVVTVPAILPVHVLLKKSFVKPSTPCLLEPLSSYHQPYLHRLTGKALAKDGDGVSTKDLVKVSAEIMHRFGTMTKVTKTTVTHSVSDVLRLALGFASGLRSLTFECTAASFSPAGVHHPSDHCDVESDSSGDESETSKSKSCHDDSDCGSSTICAPLDKSRLLFYLNDPLEPHSVMPIRFSDGAQAEIPHELYRQTKHVLGKVRTGDHDLMKPPPSARVSFDAAIGVLMTPCIESFFIQFGCPMADITPIMMDVSNFNAESLCSVLRNAPISSIVVDDSGLELLSDTYALWRSEVQVTPWPIDVVVFSSLVVAEQIVNSKLASVIKMIDLEEVIIKDLSSSIPRLLKWRSSANYSVTEFAEPQGRLQYIFPRPLSLSFSTSSNQVLEPLWSCQLMNSVAGVMALEAHLDWSLKSHDVVMLCRNEVPTGDGIFSHPSNHEASTSYQLAIYALAVGGKVALVPLVKLLQQGSHSGETIRQLNPTIAVGSLDYWTAFAKRLSHEAGIDGIQMNKSLKNKLVDHRWNCAPSASRCTQPDKPSSKKTNSLKNYMYRKVLDPVTFRHGRHLLGSAIRLAFVVEPLTGSAVMHEKTLTTLTTLMSSSKMSFISSFGITGLGGQPCALMSTAMTRSSNNYNIPPMPGNSVTTDMPYSAASSRLPIHTGDFNYHNCQANVSGDRMDDPRTFLAELKYLVNNVSELYDRRLTIANTCLPKELTDAQDSMPALSPCVINPSLDMMLSGFNESDYATVHHMKLSTLSSYPLGSSGSHVIRSMTNSDLRRSTCKVSTAIRLASNGPIRLTLDYPNRAFVPGTYAQIQDELLTGPIYPRVCINDEKRTELRISALSNFLTAHSFYIARIKTLWFNKSLSLSRKQSLLSQGAARNESSFLGPNSNRLEISIVFDRTQIPDIRPSESGGSWVMDTQTNGSALMQVIGASVLGNFATMWCHGQLSTLLDGNDQENCGYSDADPSIYASLDDVIERHDCNIDIQYCKVDSEFVKM